MRTITARIIATALFAGLASSAGATIVVNNGLPNQSGGSDMNGFLEAENFSLGAASTSLNLVRFWSLQGGASDYAGSIQWSIRLNSGGVPGAIAASGLATPTGVDTLNSAFGLEEFRYEFGISATLAAGNYWLTLHNGPDSSQPDTAFYWEWSHDTGDSQNLDLLFPTQGWKGNFSELAFQLEGQSTRTVPEPATIFLFGAGLAAMMTRRRRQLMRAN